MVDIGLPPAERIEELELRIEDLGEAVARSRKLAAAGRICAVVGPILLLALMAGALAFTPARVLLALALLIGGVVLAGSSKSSTDELRRSLARAEAERNAAIDALGLIDAGEEAAAESARPPELRKRLN